MGEEVSGTAKISQKDWHELLHANVVYRIVGPGGVHHPPRKIDKVILHDEDRSGEQDAMEEVSGTDNHSLKDWHKLLNKDKIVGPGGVHHPPKKIDKVILHDEDRSGEQDAMEEVSGTAKLSPKDWHRTR